MVITDFAKEYHERMFPVYVSDFHETDPEFFESFNNLAFDEVINMPLAEVDIFGEGMRDFWKSGPEESKHINYWLAGNCFGDYYTRTGLDYKKREMITFCFIAAQGGYEPQLIGHAKGNMCVGNDKAFLIQLISQCLPFIGYPRTLNALACINKVAE